MVTAEFMAVRRPSEAGKKAREGDLALRGGWPSSSTPIVGHGASETTGRAAPRTTLVSQDPRTHQVRGEAAKLVPAARHSQSLTSSESEAVGAVLSGIAFPIWQIS